MKTGWLNRLHQPERYSLQGALSGCTREERRNAPEPEPFHFTLLFTWAETGQPLPAPSVRELIRNCRWHRMRGLYRRYNGMRLALLLLIGAYAAGVGLWVWGFWKEAVR